VTSQCVCPSGVVTGLPNLSSQVSVLPVGLFGSSLMLKMNEPPLLLLPPLAFQYLSATVQKRGSSAARDLSVASIACFSEQTRPIWTSPFCTAKTCGRSIAVSVIPSSWNSRSYFLLRAMMKNHGPSGEPCMCAIWILR
jgi:hypothetical protein